jgi:hypothetical protein
MNNADRRIEQRQRGGRGHNGKQKIFHQVVWQLFQYNAGLRANQGLNFFQHRPLHYLKHRLFLLYISKRCDKSNSRIRKIEMAIYLENAQGQAISEA